MLRKTSLKIDEMPFDVGLCSDKSLMYATHGIVPHRTVGVEDTNHLQNFRANSVFQNETQPRVSLVARLIWSLPDFRSTTVRNGWSTGGLVRWLKICWHRKIKQLKLFWFHPEVVVFPEIDVFVATFSDALIRLCCERRDAGCFFPFFDSTEGIAIQPQATIYSLYARTHTVMRQIRCCSQSK